LGAIFGLEVDQIETLADGGYYEKEQIVSCEQEQITPWVPAPKKETRNERYLLECFTYQEKEDIYLCPEGKELTPNSRTFKKNGKTQRYYQSKREACRSCLQQEKCLGKKASATGTPRKISRWEHESKLKNYKQRMCNAKAQKEKRSALVEHVFGTLKERAGWSQHFLVRGFKKVRGEFGLMVLGYNFTRVLNTIPLEQFMDYCVQRTEKVGI